MSYKRPEHVEVVRRDGVVSFEMYDEDGLTCGGADFHPDGRVVWTLLRGDFVKSGVSVEDEDSDNGQG